MIRVLLVDDHELLRAGLRCRLEREPGIAVVGEADTAERAVLMARKLQPDLPRPVKAFGYPLVPGLYLVALLGVMGTLLWAKPLTAGAGVAIVLLGVPVYLWWSKKAATA